MENDLGEITPVEIAGRNRLSIRGNHGSYAESAQIGKSVGKSVGKLGGEAKDPHD